MTQQPSNHRLFNRYTATGVDNTVGFMLCGAVSGTVSRTCAAPFERLKILFQVQDLGYARDSIDKDMIRGKRYTGIVSGLLQIYKEDGIIGYFKGNGTNCFRVIPYTAAQFVSYEKFKKWMVQRSPDGHTLNTVDRLICGGLAGMTSVLVSYPLDVVRCRLSAQNNTLKLYNGIFNCLKLTYQQEGIYGLYRGLIPTLLGIAPYVALNFTTYEYLKTTAMEFTQTNELGVITKLSLGAVSGTFAQTITYPLDVLRRRMQMQGVGGRTVEYTSLADGFKDIYAKYGIRGYYKGLLPNYLKVIPVVSINFVVYEHMKKFLGLSRSGGEV